MTFEDTSGREPIQIAEIIQPRCGNIYGTAPCTASGPDARRCFNTRATCQDIPNFRSQPESLMTTTAVANSFPITGPSNTVPILEDYFWAMDLRFGNTPEGTIFRLGDSPSMMFVGVTNNMLQLRAGGSGADPTAFAQIEVDVTPYIGKAWTLFVAIDISEWRISGWIYDAFRRELTSLGTNAASGVFSGGAWGTNGSFGVGTSDGIVPLGGTYNSSDFNGSLFQLRQYNSTSAPEMDTTFSIPLRFSRGNVVDSQIPDVPHVIPNLNSVSTTPTRINLSGSSPDSTGLGNRAQVNLSFQDHPHTDRVVDPYLDGRDYDPLERGSFWTKWFVRNRFRYNLPIIVYEGYAGQNLSEMTNRSYLMTSTTGPTERGAVTIQGKDLLTQVEDRKAQYPRASSGELAVALDAVTTTFMTLNNAVAADYPAPGTVRIDDEVIQFTSVVTVTPTQIQLHGLIRASDNTIAAPHDLEDKVQLCVRYTSQNVDALTYDLMVTGAGIDPGFINVEQAASERDSFLAAYILSTLITEPTSVATLLSELQEQVGFYLWWDERQQLINFRAVRGFDESVPIITDSFNFIENSFSVSDRPRSRISQVWFNYARRNPVNRLDQTASFRQVLVQADLPSETGDQYGEPSIRQIFSRWIDSAALALGTASRIVVRYSTIPRQCKFRLDAKDRSLWVGDSTRINHFLEINQFGERINNVWTILSAEEVVPGEVVEYIAEDTTLYGRIYLILPNNEPDYNPSTSPFTGAFIGDNNGLLSDGTQSARIT